MRHTSLLLLGLAAPLSAQVPVVPFKSGMVITRSVRVRPGTYSAAAGDSGVIVVRGSHVTVDLSGVTLVGNADRMHPDRFTGTAIRIDGGSDVTVRGIVARGYKVGIIARGVTGLRLLDNNLSYNYKPRLYSGITKESLIDWLDYHQNEKDEWLRYGAGIYLTDIHGGELRGNIVRQGMDGVMLTRCDSLKVWNNDLSFNSGVGLGLYRSSYNTIMHNRIDYDVRGFSYGYYYRGQDSAGLLIYEQSSDNVVAYNSVTHGGDGLFLWAGQTTMDSGTGGCNDNLFYHNDFSYAPTNGMEATFARNRFVANRVVGNWHGFWGGYSYQSVVLNNTFGENIEGISIEHGQNNVIRGNSFSHDTVDIHLWWSGPPAPDWGYGQHRDTHSMDYQISDNSFRGSHVGVWINNTQRATVAQNAFASVDTTVRLTGDSTGIRVERASRAPAAVALPDSDKVAPLPGGMTAITPPAQQRGRAGMIIDDWGPYDWRSPKLWPVGTGNATPLKLRTLGPAGSWRVVSRDGIARLSRSSGRIGDTITVTPTAGHGEDFGLTLEYRGAAVTTPFGEHIAAGTPVRFGWSRFQPIGEWHVKFVPWDSTTAPLNDAAAIDRALARAPVATLDTNRLDLTWYGPPSKAIPQADVLTEATARVTLGAGIYVIRTIADDAVKVYVDGKLVLSDWVPGESHVKEVPFRGAGTHRLRVVHLQKDGWYELRVDVGK
jgi:parallel beta-helix repeat protein